MTTNNNTKSVYGVHETNHSVYYRKAVGTNSLFTVTTIVWDKITKCFTGIYNETYKDKDMSLYVVTDLSEDEFVDSDDWNDTVKSVLDYINLK